MRAVRAEPRPGGAVAVIIDVDSTVQEEITLTAEEGTRLAREILAAFPDTADAPIGP